MITDAAWALIPDNFPVDSPVWIENSAKSADLSNREHRAYAWAMHLLSRLGNRDIVTAIMGIVGAGNIPLSPPIVQDISAGFIPYQRDGQYYRQSHRTARMRFSERFVEAEEINYTFGVLIGISNPEGRRVSEEADTPSQVVDIDGFPVVVELRQIVQNSPPHPIGVASACYATPRQSKRFFGPPWSSGILIARHVLAPLGYSIGNVVSMSSGVSMSVVDVDTSASTIDAAILDCGSIPASVSSLPIAPAIAPGGLVDVMAPAMTFSAQVLRINDHPSYFGNMIAHRVFVDKIGMSGDSGSLVLQANPRNAVGLYMGSTGGPMPEGLVQSMRQVVQYFDIDIYD